MKVLFLFGTRPEAIKLIPVIFAMRSDPFFTVEVGITAQHREMLDQVLNLFDIAPDYDLNLMTDNQTLSSLTSRALEGIDHVLKASRPDLCIIQGDTTTVLASALSCFYNKVKVAHVEAGLRTYMKYSPFPEEINRRVATQVCDFHFAPTEDAQSNLLKEGVLASNIFVTGNTVIDALLFMKRKLDSAEVKVFDPSVIRILANKKPFILVTSHRRENFGDGIESICRALNLFAKEHEAINIVFPVHLNPNIKTPVFEILQKRPNIFLLPPVDYVSFVALMSGSYLILTDSGGVQEEATGFNKPVLVMRDSTERPEGLRAGLSMLVGTNANKIYSSLVLLVNDKTKYMSMANGTKPYGDGTASQKIVATIKGLA